MDPGATLLVGVGGSIGAMGRYTLGRLVDAASFPLATLTVNVLGSFLLGLVTFLAPGESLALLVGTGACGAFTTFSSFSVETVGLWDDGRPAAAVGNAVINLVAALGAVGLAWLLLAP